MESLSNIEQEMREQEALHDQRLPADHWIILRLDGRGFSGLTETHFAKPFDQRFHDLMVSAAGAVFTELEARFALVGSDEISLVLPPAWTAFDRRAEKLLSLAASITTDAFVREARISAQFDCRLQTRYLFSQVVSYIHWRLMDIERNARSTLTYWTLRGDGLSARQATKRLMHAHRQAQEQILAGYSLDFATLPTWQRQGVGIVWQNYEKQGYDPIRHVEVMAQRRRMAVVELPQTVEERTPWLVKELREPIMEASPNGQ